MLDDFMKEAEVAGESSDEIFAFGSGRKKTAARKAAAKRGGGRGRAKKKVGRRGAAKKRGGGK